MKLKFSIELDLRDPVVSDIDKEKKDISNDFVVPEPVVDPIYLPRVKTMASKRGRQRERPPKQESSGALKGTIHEYKWW